MYDPGPYQRARPSFVEPVRVPAGSASDPPTVCVEIAAAWVPYMVGALLQLALPTTWITASDAAQLDILGRVQDLIDAVGTAGACMQAGTIDLTIPAGSASAGAAIPLVAGFAAPPVIVVSERTGLYIASASGVGVDTFVATVTANVTLRADGPTTLSWIARAAT